MSRLAEQVLRLRNLHHHAGIHHHHTVAKLRHNAQIMRDVQNAHAQLLLQFADQLQNLRLNGGIQRGDGLICDQQAGVGTQRHGDHYALAHAAGQLMRIVFQSFLRHGHAYQLEHLLCLCPGGFFIHVLMQHHGLHDLVAAGVHRVERCHGLLKDHGDFVAAHRAHLFFRQLQNIAPLEENLAAQNACRGRGEQTHHIFGRDRLAGTRFADQTKDFPLFHRDGHIRHHGNWFALKEKSAG